MVRDFIYQCIISQYPKSKQAYKRALTQAHTRTYIYIYISSLSRCHIVSSGLSVYIPFSLPDPKRHTESSAITERLQESVLDRGVAAELRLQGIVLQQVCHEEKEQEAGTVQDGKEVPGVRQLFDQQDAEGRELADSLFSGLLRARRREVRHDGSVRRNEDLPGRRGSRVPEGTAFLELEEGLRSEPLSRWVVGFWLLLESD